ncbi:hypothetical protein FACS1894145_4350 [Bacteroidia bacterium]|nr:hypothetical protein FACS1894145_4350 [Bacteroidia bacterium]
MALNFTSLREKAVEIKNEIRSSMNSSSRVGILFGDMIDKIEEAFTTLGQKLNKSSIVNQLSDSIEDVPSVKLVKDNLVQLERESAIFNVTQQIPPQSGYYTSETARAAVPLEIRKPGLIITYATSEGEWKTEQYKIDDISGWGDDSNWKAITSGGQSAGGTVDVSRQRAMVIKTADSNVVPKYKFADFNVKSADMVITHRLTEDNKNFECSVGSNGAIGYIKTIHWGDGAVVHPSYLPADYRHIYGKAGTYTISIEVDNNYDWSHITNTKVWWFLRFDVKECTDIINYNVRHPSALIIPAGSLSPNTNLSIHTDLEVDATDFTSQGYCLNPTASHAYQMTGIEKVDINLNNLSMQMFGSSSKLKTVIIRGLSSVGVYGDAAGWWFCRAFDGCPVENMYIRGTIPSLPNDTFTSTVASNKTFNLILDIPNPPSRMSGSIWRGNAGLMKIYVPAASVNAYKSAWNDLAGNIYPITGEQLAVLDANPERPDFVPIDADGQTIIEAEKLVFQGDGNTVYSFTGGSAKELEGNIPIPRQLATLRLDGNFGLINGDVSSLFKVKLSADGNDYSGFANVKWQGSSSLGFPRKNLRLDLLDVEGNARKVRFGNWCSMDSYDIKTDWTDPLTHSANVGCANIIHAVNQVTPYADRYPFWPKTMRIGNGAISPDVPVIDLVDSGARGVIDGFPLVIYINGEFYGLGMWNIKKDRANMQMEKNNNNHIWCEWVSAQLNATPNWGAEYEIRNPSIPGYAAGGTPPDGDVKNAILNFLSWLNTTSNFRDEAPSRLWLTNIMDYFIHLKVWTAPDNLIRNMQMATWDGVKWALIWYDMDAVFGGTGAQGWSGTPRLGAHNNKICNLLWANFQTETRARYAFLRESGVLSVDFYEKTLRSISEKYPIELIQQDVDKWFKGQGASGTYGRTIPQMLNWIQTSIPLADTFFGYNQ